MSLNNREYMRRRQTEFVQLPLPYMGRKRRAWRWVRRALCSEWFNVALALTVAAVALVYFGGES